MAQLERVGVFGGTFDPPHKGHVAVATAASIQLGLTVVWWLPVASPPHKADSQVTPIEHRYAMLRLTLKNTPDDSCSILTTDMDRPGPHYMVDTIRILRREHAPDEIYLLIGEDSLNDLPNWSRPNQLIDQVTLAVYPRGEDRSSLAEVKALLPGIRQNLVYIRGDYVDISATQIRARVHQGLPIDDLVMPGVARYISRQKLYLQSYVQ